MFAVPQTDGRAAAAGQVLVTGAGFGVLGTESVVLRLCAARQPATGPDPWDPARTGTVLLPQHTW